MRAGRPEAKHVSMIRTRPPGRRFGAGAWALVALAVVLRLSFAPGYMIEARTDRVAVVMCTSQGAVTSLVDSEAPGQPSPGDHDQQAHKSPCAFSLTGASLAAPDHGGSIARDYVSGLQQGPLPAPRFAPAFPVGPPLSTGPPTWI
ncbi:MAG: hypothetical protein K9G59_07740 [Caulobacter sp.]|nr:hypothetical protein [Caulobacter sp.]